MSGTHCGDGLEPPNASPVETVLDLNTGISKPIATSQAGSLSWLDEPTAAESTAPLGKAEHDAVNAKLQENYARRVNLGSNYSDFVAWVETRSPFPENRDQQEAWSQAVLELYAHRRT